MEKATIRSEEGKRKHGTSITVPRIEIVGPIGGIMAQR